MKSFFLLILTVLGLSFSTKAQSISDNAMGLRFGSGYEFSYQKRIATDNRLELDLGLGRNDLKLTALYQWIWYINSGFNWYAGAGGGGGIGHRFSIFGAGNIGIEYKFDFPLQLSLDLRPELYLNSWDSTMFFNNLGLSVRYCW